MIRPKINESREGLMPDRCVRWRVGRSAFLAAARDAKEPAALFAGPEVIEPRPAAYPIAETRRLRPAGLEVTVLPLSGLIADGVAVGAGISLNSKDLPGILIGAVLSTPVLLVLATGCGLVVARGWTSAVWAAASSGTDKSVGLREALRWSRHRSRLLWGSYLAGMAILTGGAYLAGYAAPGDFAVADLLVLAGPAGLLAPVLCFAPAAAWRRAPGPGEPPTAQDVPAVTGRLTRLMPMAVVLAVVVACEVAAALALSWLLTSPYATGAGLEGNNGPAAAVLASLVAVPGSVLLAASSTVTYASVRNQA